MSESWYAVVDANTALTQGDLIFDCPLIAWNSEPVDLAGQDELEVLKAVNHATVADVVVMTQACDLAHDKVSNVILCPHLSLSEYRGYWEAEMRAQAQNPTDKAWRGTCDDIREGHVWNLAILNRREEGPLMLDHRIVDFHEVFSVPRAFLESFLGQRGDQRPRLLPPYREHLSQAFARFFMRVGLPTPVVKGW